MRQVGGARPRRGSSGRLGGVRQIGVRVAHAAAPGSSSVAERGNTRRAERAAGLLVVVSHFSSTDEPLRPTTSRHPGKSASSGNFGRLFPHGRRSVRGGPIRQGRHELSAGRVPHLHHLVDDSTSLTLAKEATERSIRSQPDMRVSLDLLIEGNHRTIVVSGRGDDPKRGPPDPGGSGPATGSSRSPLRGLAGATGSGAVAAWVSHWSTGTANCSRPSSTSLATSQQEIAGGTPPKPFAISACIRSQSSPAGELGSSIYPPDPHMGVQDDHQKRTPVGIKRPPWSAGRSGRTEPRNGWPGRVDRATRGGRSPRPLDRAWSRRWSSSSFPSSDRMASTRCAGVIERASKSEV